MDPYLILAISISVGILPALFWLWFWLREDRIHPEPRSLIFMTFVGGMFAVIGSLFIEGMAQEAIISSSIVIIFLAPLIEEFLKYLAARSLALNRAEDDEPIDPMIYMITVALGFAALENAFFMYDSLTHSANIAFSLTSANFRFIGATLLHLVSSATIGLFMGFSFYDREWLQRTYTFIGFIAAVGLHTFFNLFIMSSEKKYTLATFGAVWISIVVLLLIFERVKRIHPVFAKKLK